MPACGETFAIILDNCEKLENMGGTREEFEVPLDTAAFTTKFVLNDKWTIRKDK